MSKKKKKLVSFERFTALLNEELRRRPWYDNGMEFVTVSGQSGYDLVGTDDADRGALTKEVHDLVFAKYVIAR